MDTGRQDAAPRGGDSSSPGSSGSTFRSENNFGTSAIVPGAAAAGAAAGAGGAGAGSGSGEGTEGSNPDLDPASSLDTGDPSVGGGYGLLIVVALGGVLLGVAAARTRVNNSR